MKSGAVEIPKTDWAFANCATTPFPGQARRRRAICVKGGFNPALLYELRYIAKDPLVLGIGFAATRDINSFFRYEKQDGARLRRIRSQAASAGRVSEGSSQSGTFLRAFIHLGFNQDENGRIVWDGSNPHIASRVIDMNRRFAVPGGTVSLYELGMEAPLWWGDWDDTPRGRGKGRLARPLPRVEHLPEDHGDVRQRRDLRPARVADAGGDRREGGHSAAGRTCAGITSPASRTAAVPGGFSTHHWAQWRAGATCPRTPRPARRCARR